MAARPIRRYVRVLRRHGAFRPYVDALRGHVPGTGRQGACVPAVVGARNDGVLHRRTSDERFHRHFLHDRLPVRIHRRAVAPAGVRAAGRVQRDRLRDDAAQGVSHGGQDAPAQQDGVRIRSLDDGGDPDPALRPADSALLDRVSLRVLLPARVRGRGRTRRDAPAGAARAQLRGAARSRAHGDSGKEPILLKRFARHPHAAQRHHRLF